MARQLITLNLQSTEVLDTNSNRDRYLSLACANEVFGINILQVKEIIEYCDLTPIPRMPVFIRGALNLRGQVVPVLDLSHRLDKEPTEVSSRSCIVIVELASDRTEEMEVGLLIDAVHKVIDIDPQDIRPAPSFDGAINTDFIHGMGKVDDNFIILLNIDRVLSLKDITMLSETQQFTVPPDSSADESAQSAL